MNLVVRTDSDTIRCFTMSSSAALSAKRMTRGRTPSAIARRRSARCLLSSEVTKIAAKSDHRLRVDNFSRLDPSTQVTRHEPTHLDALIIHGRRLPRGKAGRQKDGHLLRQESGTWKKRRDL